MSTLPKLISLIIIILYTTFLAYSREAPPRMGPDSIKYLLQIAEPGAMSPLYNQLAEKYTESDPELAISYTDTSIHLARILDQNQAMAKAYEIRGKAFSKKKMLDSAIYYFDKSFNIYNGLGDRAAVANAFHLYGQVFMAMNKYENAILYFEKSLETETERGDSSGMGKALSYVGLAYDKWEKYDTALLYYNKALKIVKNTGDKSREAFLKNNLGNIYMWWGNYDLTIEYYMASLEISQEIQDSTTMGNTYNNLGIIYHDWNEWDKSIYYYRLSYRIDSLRNNILGQAQTLNNIAIVYDERGSDNEALRIYLQSLELARQENDLFQIAVSSSNIGTIYLESQDFDNAENYFLDAFKYYKDANSVIGVAETNLLLADLYRERKQYEASIKHYNMGIEALIPMNLPQTVMNAYDGISSTYYEMGDYRKAYEYNEKFHNISDSIFTLQASRQLSLVTNVYEVQQKEQEMQLQQIRLEEQRSKIRRQNITVLSLVGVILLIVIYTLILIGQYRLRVKAWKKLVSQHIEILENRKALLKAKEKAEESDKLKTSFLINLSHELRTPMNGIMGFTDLLQKGTATKEEQQTYLSYLASSSRQLLRVLNDIIDISSIETGQLNLNPEPCNLHNLLLDLEKHFIKEKDEVGKEDLELKYSAPAEEQHIDIIADKRRLAQVIYNIINNAIGFTKEGEVEFGYGIVGDRLIRIFVRDTGIGIERQYYELIFERFRQVDSSTTRHHGGSGLGLAISRELVNMMGGNIFMESEVGKGTTFFIEIPYNRA